MNENSEQCALIVWKGWAELDFGHGDKRRRGIEFERRRAPAEQSGESDRLSGRRPIGSQSPNGKEQPLHDGEQSRQLSFLNA